VKPLPQEASWGFPSPARVGEPHVACSLLFTHLWLLGHLMGSHKAAPRLSRGEFCGCLEMFLLDGVEDGVSGLLSTPSVPSVAPLSLHTRYMKTQ
jgi:hypothetical protein